MPTCASETESQSSTRTVVEHDSKAVENARKEGSTPTTTQQMGLDTHHGDRAHRGRLAADLFRGADLALPAVVRVADATRERRRALPFRVAVLRAGGARRRAQLRLPKVDDTWSAFVRRRRDISLGPQALCQNGSTKRRSAFCLHSLPRSQPRTSTPSPHRSPLPLSWSPPGKGRNRPGRSRPCTCPTRSQCRRLAA